MSDGPHSTSTPTHQFDQEEEQMPRDSRTYVRMHDGLPDSPKLLGIDADGITIALCGWLWSCSVFHASRSKSDGLIPVLKVPSLLPDVPEATTQALASHLLEAKLWHEAGHECASCPQPPARHYIVHDYLEHQRSRAEIDKLINSRINAGRKGGKARAAKAEAQANAQASAWGGASSKTQPDTDTDTDTEETPNPSLSPAAPDDEVRPDVEALCSRLAELMAGNGCKPPKITQGWRTAARLLLDRDGRELDKAMRLLEWCQADEFWRTNVLSMPTFRKQYEKLRLRALAEWERANGNGTVLPFRRPQDDLGGDAHMERYLARVEARKAAAEGREAEHA